MKQGYDVIIVGAGPAGLMAAKTAAELNLKVALIERRIDITKWTRADCMMLYGLEGNFLGEDIKVEVGKITFPKNKFEVNYSGALYPLYHWRVMSSGGHRIDFSSKQPIATVFDKGILLRDLLGEVAQLRVSIFSGTLGMKAENTETGARVLIKSKSTEHWLEAKKVIAADGVNSRITQSIGLNEGRTLMGMFRVVQYIMEGVENPYPNSWVQFYGPSISPFAPPHCLQTVHGEKLQKLGAIQPAPGNPENALKRFIREGRFSSWFKTATVAYKMGFSVKAFLPLKRPVIGNVLAIGDAAAFAEVENQGALMCGHHAAHAVRKAIDGAGGIDDYLRWWQQSFEFLNPDIHRIAQGYAINPYYDDEEIDYLISLVEGEVYEGSINQYKIPKMLWEAIFRHKDRILKERPALNEKIEQIQKMTLQDAFTIDRES